MVYREELLAKLEAIEQRPWGGEVYRYCTVGRDPMEPNHLGARWNPPGTPAIYTALDREAARAEFAWLLEQQAPQPSKGRFVLYRVSIHVERIVDVCANDVLTSIDISKEDLVATDFAACQSVGGASAWLDVGGLWVPSARRIGGRNLVIFSQNQGAGFKFEIAGKEPLLVEDRG